MSMANLNSFIFAFIFLLSSFGKSELIKAPSGGDFKIGSIDTSKMRDKTLFVFFGFTKCPHICPLTISNLKQMINLLSESEKDSVRILFISVDNIRDSNSSLAQYLQPFGPQFLSATGSDKALRKITSSFGAGYARFKTSSGALLVDHTSSVFVVNKKGQWAMTLSNNSTGEELAKALKTAETRTKPPLPEPFDAEFLGENTTCDLSKQICTLKTKKGNFAIEFSPRPIVTQQNIKISVSAENSELTPKETDLTSIEVNMGYLRPPLGTDQNKFSGQIRFPVCEQKKMRWIMRVILSDKDGKNYFAGFRFTTTEPK